MTLTHRPPADELAPGRGFWFMRDIPTVVWIALAVVSTLVHRQLPEPRWLMIHLLLLGAITHAILVWSQYFSFALLRSRASKRDRRGQNARLVMANLGAVAVLVGVPSGVWASTAAGAALLIAAVLWHAASLVARLRASLPGRFGGTIRYYIAAALLLAVGAALGALAARGGIGAHLGLAHAIVNVLGWVGLAVAGTLVTLWPTILRTRAAAGAARGGAAALPLLAAGVVAAAAGAGLGWEWLLVAGLAVYLAGLAVIAVSGWQAGRQTPPTTFPALSVAAAFAWWAGSVASVAVAAVIAALTGAGFDAVERGIDAAVPYLAAGFAAQVLVGALSYLIPVALGGGPRAVRAGTEGFDRGGAWRVVVANAALAVCALPVSSVMRVVASILYLIAMASFLVVMPLAMRAQRRAKTGAADAARRGAESGAGAIDPPVRGGRGRAAQAVGGLLAVVLAMAVCVAADPTGLKTGGGPSGDADAPVTTVEVTAADMSFTPNRIEVPAGSRLVVELTNADPELTHDLVFANGAAGDRIDPGERTTIDVGVITGDLDGWCSIIGHKQMGMTLQVVATGDAAGSGAEDGSGSGEPGSSGTDHAHGSSGASGGDSVIDLTAEPGGGFEPFEAALEPLPAADGPVTHRETLAVTDSVVEVAPGVTQTLWTYNGTAPGPILHGRVGDAFEITLVNDATMGHSIDFHAGALAPDEPMRTIAPGESLTYTFTADRAGIWMYHCSTMPMAAHIANGMYGAVVIEPDDLPAVERSYVLVQGEYYLGDHDAGEVDVDALATGDPDLVTFNGYANQYDHAPLEAETDERVRVWVLDAGVERSSSFHVIGGQFDTVWSEGRYLIGAPGEADDSAGSQALALAPAQGGFVELAFPEAGTYPFVSHYMRDAERGAHGLFDVTG